ncbi:MULTISPECIES: DUF2189 domain-containing protein [Rhodobacterales]|jgi:uncharacterized membrane protein|uniref:DUF2189 domain-containing protein n=1 Tax=Rhodobacterales TaxID=204455 RepID=UPI00237F2084|nr:DUF2189 domain-containing protein [Phaeobacter gallaeciensis]MDE4140101.1 DUF2189 domain-containing protein [Phaeobacter gallaeciensis]MDE4148289.1 DUF2189 domain-containing protein [Phaeobacter gallaeciensis]MDE4152768.1 DUF2189 domain-containing protein [Phaeobacter gallaeciensis]MDE4227899.1 DUF2189 domain-containing protein [Phaeobacter gallaeciensis]MDE4257233.1 DUF2189 domain-containing protein [Phaeobacter gallaeciensis]
MAKTIGNPLSWLLQGAETTGQHFGKTVGEMGSSDVTELPQARRLSMDDLIHSLAAGLEDFAACRSDAMFLVLFYPVIGLALIVMSLSMNLLPLIVPMIMGFAILGPVAAVGLYEMSSRREAGFKPRWMDAFGVIRSPAFGAILVLGFYLAALFIIWLVAADMIYIRTLGPEPPTSMLGFATAVVTTREGWIMAIAGGALGAVFAFAALAMSLVSFPLLLDRHVGLPVAVATSINVLRKNPVICITWGVIVGSMLVIAAIPFLAGLIIVMPVLGHATWHLYRRAVK